LLPPGAYDTETLSILQLNPRRKKLGLVRAMTLKNKSERMLKADLRQY
jgi:hypothetical protein